MKIFHGFLGDFLSFIRRPPVRQPLETVGSHWNRSFRAWHLPIIRNRRFTSVPQLKVWFEMVLVQDLPAIFATPLFVSRVCLCVPAFSPSTLKAFTREARVGIGLRRRTWLDNVVGRRSGDDASRPRSRS